MADPEITTPVGKPPFPAYVSGHSSFSGTASGVLAYIFPTKATRIYAMADEAAVSRLYGGIHYSSDNDKGLEAGRIIAQMAIEKGMNDGCSDV